MRRTGGSGALLPLLAVAVATAAVGAGLARGVWLANLHNGLLGLAFALVGAAVLLQRPGQREGVAFVVIGLLEAAVFLGRQVGHDPGDDAARWWAWLGVWPVALVLGAVTWAVLCFPEGRFLSPVWRRVFVGAAVLVVACSLASALWPVEYTSAGVTTPHPLDVPGLEAARLLWDAVAHPLYVVLQLLWVAAVVARWRVSDPVARRQLTVLLVAVALPAVGLLAGLAVAGTPRLGLLTTALVPLAAGWTLERLSLAKVIEQESAAGRLEELTPREAEVLALLAEGLSNPAIAARLHLSIKTVEPVVSSIFVKLGLPADSDRNRRVLAVLEYLRR